MNTENEKIIALAFAEWIQYEGYWKRAEKFGGNWFKLNDGEPKFLSMSDLFDKFKTTDKYPI